MAGVVAAEGLTLTLTLERTPGARRGYPEPKQARLQERQPLLEEGSEVGVEHELDEQPEGRLLAAVHEQRPRYEVHRLAVAHLPTAGARRSLEWRASVLCRA